MFRFLLHQAAEGLMVALKCPLVQPALSAAILPVLLLVFCDQFLDSLF